MDLLLTQTIIIVYLAGLISIGLLSKRKITTAEDFYLANRSLRIFPLTATITATVVGGSATIATAKLIYLNGIASIWLDIGAATGLIILGLFLASKVRTTGLFTLPEISGTFFNERVRFAAAVLILITQIAWIALLIQGAGAIIYILLPSFDYNILLISITLIFILYTLLGGQFAVVYTDIIQFFIMIIGVCVIAAPLLLFQAAPQLNMISADHLMFPINANIGVLSAASFFFMMLMPHIVGPDIYSKVLSAKDESTARKGVLFSGIFRIIFAVCIGVIAISAIVLVPGLPAEEAVFAMPKSFLLLGPLGGIILAAFLSVILSSADSILISSSTVFSIDILRKKDMRMSRLMIVAIGILALILALYLKDIVNTLQLAYTVFTSGLTFPILFGFYKKKTRVTSTGALISLVCGGGISLLWLLYSHPFGIDAVLIGMVISIIPLLLFRADYHERITPTKIPK